MLAQEKTIPVENRKSEHHLLILHIRISVDTNFQLKLTILFFFLPNLGFLIALLPPPMVVSYSVKRFRLGADGHNGVLMSLLLQGQRQLGLDFICHGKLFSDVSYCVSVYDPSCI